MKKRLALLILLVAIVVIALLWWRENRRYDGPVQQVTAGAEQIARGRYLAQAADCAACHTASGGAPLAGGLSAGYAVRHHLRQQPDAFGRPRHWPLDQRRFLPGPDPGRGAGRPPSVPGDALHLV
ncbi:Cytochrome c, mono- and diheme variants [Serratia entomophila]|nr:Cytochrome c, mono- and diheme variants [Serratia entomophila]